MKSQTDMGKGGGGGGGGNGAAAYTTPASGNGGADVNGGIPRIKSVKSVMSLVDTKTIRKEGAGWDNQIEFIMTCISYAVGLGNVWRFPYLCYDNGGGAFLLPYCIMLVLVGMPIFFLELSFGQFASLGPLTIWTINPLFKGLGYAMVAVTFVIALYYNVIIAQCALYFVKSFTLTLPWETCGNSWNTPNCTVPVPRNDTLTVANSTKVADKAYYPIEVVRSKVNITETNEGVLGFIGTNTEEYYYNYILHQSPLGINDMGVPQMNMAISLLVCWTIVALGLIKGIKSLGKISYFTALFPYVMLTVLLVRSVILPGALDGILFYIKPDWEKLGDPSVWQAAANQIFFNLSCATGGLIAMASFNKFRNNCLRDALIVPILNALTSVFAGLVVFSVLGFMAQEKGLSVEDVVSKGPGLVFIAYPEALGKLPFPYVWSVLFFLMMLTLGFGSELSLVETVLTAFQDDLANVINTKARRIIYRVSYCLFCFALGLVMVTRGGIYVLTILDEYISFIALIIVCLLEVIALAWIYGFPEFRICEDVSMMLGKPPPLFFRIMWRYITPISLLALLIGGFVKYQHPAMIIANVNFHFPGWAIGLGWFVAVFPLLFIPIWLIYYIYVLGGCQELGDHIHPMVNWGPADPEDRRGRYSAQTEAIQEMLKLQAAEEDF